MNLPQLRALARTHLNEAHASFWSDGELDRFLNVANRKVHNRIKTVSRYHFTTRATFQTTAGNEYYQLPANMKDLRLVSRIVNDAEAFLIKAPWPDPDVWTPAGYLGPDEVSGDEAPQYYWLVGASIRLLPKPRTVTTIRLYYEARITDLAGDNTPTCDEDYHDMIAKWAAIEAATKDEKLRQDILALYNLREQDMIQDVFHRISAPAQETESYLQEFL